MNLLTWPAILAAALTALILGIVQLAHAASTPACPPLAEAPYCIVMLDVHTSPNITQSTRYLLTNEEPGKLGVVEHFYDLEGMEVVSGTRRELAYREPRNFYVEYPQLGAHYTGTAVITGTQAFTVQRIDPSLGDCPHNSDLTCMEVLLTAGQTFYTLRNTEATPITSTHRVYMDNALAFTTTNTLQALETVTYDASSGQPLAGASPQHQAVPSALATYRIEVLEQPEQPEQPVDPTPTSATKSYLPYVVSASK